MRPLGRLATLALSTLAVTACTTMSVGSHVRSGLDFSGYRTYDWGPPDAFPTQDPRLDGDPFFHDHMQGAVDRALAAAGFERVVTGERDLLIHYHASVTHRIDINRAEHDPAYCSEPDCVPVIEFEAGTLVLDLMDARTGRLVWRGWAQEALGDMLENPDTMRRRIDEAVRRMLERLPPRAVLSSPGLPSQTGGQ